MTSQIVPQRSSLSFQHFGSIADNRDVLQIELINIYTSWEDRHTSKVLTDSLLSDLPLDISNIEEVLQKDPTRMRYYHTTRFTVGRLRNPPPTMPISIRFLYHVGSDYGHFGVQHRMTFVPRIEDPQAPPHLNFEANSQHHNGPWFGVPFARIFADLQ